MREEILMLIARYQNKIRGLDGSIAESEGMEKYMLIARREAYRLEVIPDLKRLLQKCEGNNDAE